MKVDRTDIDTAVMALTERFPETQMLLAFTVAHGADARVSAMLNTNGPKALAALLVTAMRSGYKAYEHNSGDVTPLRILGPAIDRLAEWSGIGEPEDSQLVISGDMEDMKQRVFA